MTATRCTGARSCGAGITRVNAIYGPVANAAAACRKSAALHSRIMGTLAILLKLSCRALFRRQDLQTRGPPTAFNRLDELVRQLFLSHFARECGMVVFDRYEFDGNTAAFDRQK